MKTQQLFKRLGLPKHADSVYMFLQRKGPALAFHISKDTKIQRPSVYRALFSLLAHRFIYVIKDGRRKKYCAANPSIITKEFSETSSKVVKKFSQQALADNLYHQKEIRFLSGFDGIRTAFDDVISHLKYGETFYRYTSEKDLDAVNAYLSKEYRALRDRKKLERMVISNPTSGNKKKPRLERFIKFIPPNISLFDQNIIQLVYGSRISLIDLNTERVLIIENKALADFQKIIFKQLYDKLPLP